MRAWKIQVLACSITAFATSGFCVSTPAAACSENAPVPENTDSVPVTRVQLPESSAALAQKPTQAPFSSVTIANPGWNVKKSVADNGFRKPSQESQTVVAGQTRGLSGNSVQTTSAEVSDGVPLPACDNPDAESATARIPETQGNQKPSQSSPPAVGDVVQVKWKAAPQSLLSEKGQPRGVSFQGECCPFVLWNLDSPGEFLSDAVIDAAPVGSCSDLCIVQDTTGRARLASLPLKNSVMMQESAFDMNEDYLAELQQLRPKVVASGSSNAGENYLAELQQLLQRESDWLFANDALLDLAPDEGNVTGDSYLEDLNGLVKNQGTPSRRGYTRTGARQDAPVPQQSVGRTGRDAGLAYSNIAPDPKCDATGSSAIGELFKPMASIQINGLSTSPPSRNRNANSEEPAELTRPENSSCAYLENYSPICYFVPPRTGAHRPQRGVHQLCHQPLYFEDPNLERCGRSSGCLTTAVSAVHFGTTIAFIPYLTAAKCPTSCEKSLSDCPTCHSFGHDAYWPGWSWKGAAAQAAAVTGLYYAIP